jgi:hypothetical protein
LVGQPEEKITLGRPRRKWEMILKWVLGKRLGGCGLDLSDIVLVRGRFVIIQISANENLKVQNRIPWIRIPEFFFADGFLLEHPVNNKHQGKMKTELFSPACSKIKSKDC